MIIFLSDLLINSDDVAKRLLLSKHHHALYIHVARLGHLDICSDSVRQVNTIASVFLLSSKNLL